MNIGGHKVNGWYLVGGAAGVGVVIYLYKKNGGTGSGSSSSASSGGIDPVTGLPYSMDNQIDPATGMTYLNEAQTYGSVSAAEAGVGGQYGAYGGSSYYPGTAGYPTYTPADTTSSGTPGTYTTNAQWAQAVQAGLVGLGYGPQAVAAALGLFFAGHPLDAVQAGIIQAAEAEYGPPPVGTYAIITQPPGPGGGGGHPAKVTVPNVTGIDYAAAAAELARHGLVAHRGVADVGTVTHQSPAAGAHVDKGAVITLTGHGSGHPRKPHGAQPWNKHIIVGGRGWPKDVQQTAAEFGVSEAELVYHNPALSRYVGSKKPIPVKMTIVIPA